MQRPNSPSPVATGVGAWGSVLTRWGVLPVAADCATCTAIDTHRSGIPHDAHLREGTVASNVRVSRTAKTGSHVLVNVGGTAPVTVGLCVSDRVRWCHTVPHVARTVVPGPIRLQLPAPATRANGVYHGAVVAWRYAWATVCCRVGDA